MLERDTTLVLLYLLRQESTNTSFNNGLKWQDPFLISANEGTKVAAGRLELDREKWTQENASATAKLNLEQEKFNFQKLMEESKAKIEIEAKMLDIESKRQELNFIYIRKLNDMVKEGMAENIQQAKEIYESLFPKNVM